MGAAGLKGLHPTTGYTLGLLRRIATCLIHPPASGSAELAPLWWRPRWPLVSRDELPPLPPPLPPQGNGTALLNAIATATAFGRSDIASVLEAAWARAVADQVGHLLLLEPNWGGGRG